MRTGEWCGCGAYSYDGHLTERDGLYALLDALGLDDALAIRQRIQARRFNVCFMDGMVEGYFVCEVGGFGEVAPAYQYRDLGRRFEEVATAEGAPEDLPRRMYLGIAWLRSLQAAGEDQTDEACALTLRWIDEWPPVAERVRRLRSSAAARLGRRSPSFAEPPFSGA